MYFSKKILLIILTFSFLSLNGMEERDMSYKSEQKLVESNIFDESKIEEKDQEELLLNPKAIIALDILKKINSEKLTWENISELPEGLPRYIVLFHTADVYFDNSNEEPELAELITETKMLFYELISKGSEHLETFVAALDDFFCCMEIVSMNSTISEKRYALTPNTTSRAPIFKILKLILSILLDPQNKFELIKMFNNELYKGRSDLDIIEGIYSCCRMDNLASILKLLVNMDLFERNNLLDLFAEACFSQTAVDIVKVLVEKLQLTKIEFEDILKKNNKFDFVSVGVTKLDYILKLVEHFGLDVNKFINKKRSRGLTMLYSGLQFLALGRCPGILEIVRFLVERGAEVTITDDQGYNLFSYLEYYKKMSCQRLLKYQNDKNSESYQEELKFNEELEDILIYLKMSAA